MRARRPDTATCLLVGLAGWMLPQSWAWAAPSPTARPSAASASPAAAASADPASPPTEDSTSDSAAGRPPRPLAQTLAGTAKEHYDAAVLLFEDGDAAGASLKFREAYEASKDPRLLWNMAACEKQQRHYAKMIPLLEQYLDQGGPLVSEADRVEARAVLETLQPFVATLNVAANEPDADVFIDGELVGRTPLPPQRVDMGSRRITVKKPGFVEWTATESIAGGTARAIAATLKPERHVGTLRIDTDSDGAIRVDGRFVGQGHWEGELESGSHSIEVTSPGKQPYEGNTAVLDGQTATLRVALKPRQEPPPVGLPTWVWVAGGVLLATGVGLGAYALFSQDDPGRAPPIEGTMQPGAIQMPLCR
ncbi:MAG: PEGA domain-containing protein [Polyangiaceae bacterium]|nr:PEGA domain-containing protein [Polyangiaceae bacterium]